MKKIVWNILILTGAMLWAGSSAAGKKPGTEGEIRIETDTLALADDSLRVALHIAFEGAVTQSSQSLLFVPVIQSAWQSVELPAVLINGRKRDKAYRRTLAMDKRSGFSPAPFRVLRSARHTGNAVTYAAAVAYEPWMERAVLALREELYGCAGTRRLISVGTLSRLHIPPAPDTVFVEIPVLSDTPVRLEQTLEGTAYLDFPVGQSRILPDYRGNVQELAKMNRSLDSLFGDPRARIEAIYISGYASPEGSWDTNMRLSKERAEALKYYLMDRYGYEPGLYRVEWTGEDWSGLVRLLERSSAPQKARLLEIIRDTGLMGGRERKLMLLDGGAPYRYISQYLFPKLRRVEYKVVYAVDPPSEN